jgi:uncharacterized protein YbjT (DUF2867 family)
MIRDDSQAGEMQDLGGTPFVADLEGDPSPAAEGCDAIIFTAGGGPGSGAAKKETVDRQGATKLIKAAKEHGVRRYVMVSSMGADDPESGSEGMRPYLRAKGQADEALRESGLDYTIVRPGRLTDDPATGRVDAAISLGRRGEITREDTAHVLLATLTATNTHAKTFEVLAGDTPIDEAVNGL